MTAGLTLVLDPALGDGGKGARVDALAARTPAQAVRFSSGPNCGHRVETPDGRAHVFNQVPSAAFLDVPLAIRREVVVNLAMLGAELDHLDELEVPALAGRLTLSPAAPLVLPYHVALNRMREAARPVPRGSTGRGNGEALRDTTAAELPPLRVADALDRRRLLAGLEAWLPKKRAAADEILSIAGPHRARALAHLRAEAFDLAAIADAVGAAAARLSALVDPRADELHDGAILEGAQGIGLDPVVGTRPHVTPFRTTLAALPVPTDALARVAVVTRAYATRHGQGFFPAELVAAAPDRPRAVLIDRGSSLVDGDWTLPFRAGWLDVPLLRHGLAQLEPLGSRVELTLTCLDRLAWHHPVGIAIAYRLVDPARRAELEAAGVPFDPDGSIPRFHPALSERGVAVDPVLEWLDGWRSNVEDYRAWRSSRELGGWPRPLLAYVARVEALLGHPIAALTAGPTRADRVTR